MILRKKQQGVAAIEFLITIPILLLFLVGLTEIGNILITYNTLNKLSQNGARYAVVDVYGTAASSPIADESDIKRVVVYGDKNATDASTALVNGLTTSDVQVTTVGSYVTVTINHTYEPVMGDLNTTGLSFSLPLTASTKMYTGTP
ncbi:TadE/TadG family type IV pilus assembly protein [Vibrio mexicanus]|uniref:TadE/TadG family type IV pilus assembly protein n=1 Tax=Vibrio mexicanus TaxID=1004326 RepID=UPI00063C71B5|nr:TadE/TadG family type IV pilus assembly protein [Vibrio mexicanus]